MCEFETRAVHVGQNPSKEFYRPLIPPIVYTGNEITHDSSTLKCLEECIASLEHAKYGLCYPCGNGTAAAIIQILEKGDHAIIFDSVYHGTRTNFTISEKCGKVQASYLDLRDSSILESHLKENTKNFQHMCRRAGSGLSLLPDKIERGEPHTPFRRMSE